VFWLLVIIGASIILEMLPMSSSTHISFFTKLLQKNNQLPLSPEILHAFDFVMHGPILCVLALFFHQRFKLLLLYSVHYWRSALRFILLCAVIESVTVAFYLLWMKIDSRVFPIWAGFFVTTVCLLSEYFLPEHKESTQLSLKKALIIGCAQGCAFLPGISRLGITYACARWCGFSRRHAFEISFLIEAPISAAAFYKGIMDLSTMQALNLLNYKTYLIMLIATGVALQILHQVYKMVNEARWWLFGCYTCVCAIVSLMLRS
jgi:undecaprenyl-diphosphatase